MFGSMADTMLSVIRSWSSKLLERASNGLPTHGARLSASISWPGDAHAVARICATCLQNVRSQAHAHLLDVNRLAL